MALCKPPFAGPEKVLEYLAGYTHRVAISNDRLIEMDDGHVVFRFKDYARDGVWSTRCLSADEFIRRFLQRVLPRRFVRIRRPAGQPVPQRKPLPSFLNLSSRPKAGPRDLSTDRRQIGVYSLRMNLLDAIGSPKGPLS